MVLELLLLEITELLTCCFSIVGIVSMSSWAVESADVFTVFTDRSKGDSLFLTPFVWGDEVAMDGAAAAAVVVDWIVGAVEF